jgi:glycine/D-amino acid oxidase-like deaminating enzyme
VNSVLSGLAKKYPNFSVHPRTPITELNPSKTKQGLTVCQTMLGLELEVQHVIHAANGYASRLLPGLVGKIFPVRGTITAQPLGTTSPTRTHRSWPFVWVKGFEYLIQRPDGTLILGGGLLNGEEDGLSDISRADDDNMSMFSLSYFLGLLPVVFRDWGLPSGQPAGSWSGIMGFSADRQPWVGELDKEAT